MKTVGSSVLKRKKDESNIDLTPMLDVVFILLIFFVVTASFLKESAIDVRGQDPNNNPPPPSEDTPQNILIEIDNRAVVFFNQERVDISADGLKLMFRDQGLAQMVAEVGVITGKGRKAVA